MRIRCSRLAWLAVAPMLAAGLVAVSPAPPAGAVTADACQTWNGGQPVNPAGGTSAVSQIASVAAVSACDVWAVGSYQDTDADRHALIEHWTGGSWAVSPAPPALPPARLWGVSAVSASNVWAVGQAFDSDQTLILHWDGGSWTRFASPVPAGSTKAALIGIDALSASDAWAVGAAEDATFNHQLLAMHWDGTAWTSTTVPPANGDGGELVSVSGVSGSDMWALDWTHNKQPQIYHFDGNGWTQQDFPVPADSQIAGLTAISASNVWAAGFDHNTSNGNPEPLMMHWDGSGWNQVHPGNPGGAGNSTVLTSVASSSASDVWATGYYNGAAPAYPFVLHWDGSSWTAAYAPGQAPGNTPAAVALSGPGQAWIAGSGASGQTFAAPVPVVPDVSGDVVGAAIATMVTFGLGAPSGPLGHTTACPPSSSGRVVSTSPAAGLREPYGLPVSLTVCDTPATVAVPDVLSFDDSFAQAAITGAGLTVGSVTKQANCTLPAGGVLTQNPGGGTQVLPGSPVHLTESTGKQANGKRCVVN